MKLSEKNIRFIESIESPINKFVAGKYIGSMEFFGHANTFKTSPFQNYACGRFIDGQFKETKPEDFNSPRFFSSIPVEHENKKALSRSNFLQEVTTKNKKTILARMFHDDSLSTIVWINEDLLSLFEIQRLSFEYYQENGILLTHENGDRVGVLAPIRASSPFTITFKNQEVQS